MSAKLVHCLCPSRHLMMIAHVSPELDDIHALNVARQSMQDIVEDWPHCCSHCGAPPETWFCEVPPQSNQTPAGLDEPVSRGRQNKKELSAWTRPRMESSNWN